jgi:hypothetical protein
MLPGKSENVYEYNEVAYSGPQPRSLGVANHTLTRNEWVLPLNHNGSFRIYASDNGDSVLHCGVSTKRPILLHRAKKRNCKYYDAEKRMENITRVCESCLLRNNEIKSSPVISHESNKGLKHMSFDVNEKSTMQRLIDSLQEEIKILREDNSALRIFHETLIPCSNVDYRELVPEFREASTQTEIESTSEGAAEDTCTFSAIQKEILLVGDLMGDKIQSNNDVLYNEEVDQKLIPLLSESSLDKVVDECKFAMGVFCDRNEKLLNTEDNLPKSKDSYELSPQFPWVTMNHEINALAACNSMHLDEDHSDENRQKSSLAVDDSWKVFVFDWEGQAPSEDSLHEQLCIIAKLLEEVCKVNY